MNKGEIIIYQTPDGATQLDVKVEEDTVWLTQAQMAELFDTTSQNITMHVANVYGEGELKQSSTCKDFLQVRKEGSSDGNKRIAAFLFLWFLKENDILYKDDETPLIANNTLVGKS